MCIFSMSPGTWWPPASCCGSLWTVFCRPNVFFILEPFRKEKCDINSSRALKKLLSFSTFLVQNHTLSSWKKTWWNTAVWECEGLGVIYGDCLPYSIRKENAHCFCLFALSSKHQQIKYGCCSMCGVLHFCFAVVAHKPKTIQSRSTNIFERF